MVDPQQTYALIGNPPLFCGRKTGHCIPEDRFSMTAGLNAAHHVVRIFLIVVLAPLAFRLMKRTWR